MTKALPTLAQQEALFVGEGASLPAKVKIRDLPDSKLPRSASVRFAQGWAANRLSAMEIGAIAARMDGSARPMAAPSLNPNDPSTGLSGEERIEP